ncbi:hypothetical protein A2U01_0000671 [Trifolium medium]|uniref:Uncharacterized protein n=1 Tax=Trifolium medium TaxID=97028 RepID=A0A392LY81_9FABA|nr:hypothetical protein [Trifolium medium]
MSVEAQGDNIGVVVVVVVDVDSLMIDGLDEGCMAEGEDGVVGALYLWHQPKSWRISIPSSSAISNDGRLLLALIEIRGTGITAYLSAPPNISHSITCFCIHPII